MSLLPKDTMHWQLLRIYQKNLAFPIVCPFPTSLIAFYPSSISMDSIHLLNRYVPPAILYPTFRWIFLAIAMKQCDLYLTQFEFPPSQSPFSIPVPAPICPNSSFLSQLSSPTPLDTSSSLTAVGTEFGLDKDAVVQNQSFVVHIGNNQPVIFSPTRLLYVPVTHHPTSLLTGCFWCLGWGHYREDCPHYVCPNCHLSAPGHPQTACLSIQYDFFSQWGHSAQFCPTRIYSMCNWGGHIADDCPINTLSPEQATHIFGPFTSPGVWFYEGGNVMICLLSSGVLLFSFHCSTYCTYILFGTLYILTIGFIVCSFLIH